LTAGGKLTLTGPARRTIVLDADGKVKVSSDGKFTDFWELRNSEGVWRHWMDNAYTKVE